MSVGENVYWTVHFEIRYNNEILKRNVDFKSTRKSSLNKVAKLEALSKTLSPVLIDKFEYTFFLVWKLLSSHQITVEVD